MISLYQPILDRHDSPNAPVGWLNVRVEKKIDQSAYKHLQSDHVYRFMCLYS